ncbi:MAG: hypothetical protein J6T04_01150 [Bacteroidales bacterium]|nr:hypothetical protein [Bacteroidales bacterium]
MKKVILLSVIVFVGSVLLAQNERVNNAVVRLNYNVNIYNSLGNDIGHNFTPGVSFDFGAKQFLYKDKGWFLEEAPSFLFNDLPFAKRVSVEKREIAVMPYSRLRELGLGLYVVGGYDFKIHDKLSFDVFIGPDIRYLIRYYPQDCGVKDCTDHRLHKANLRLRLGAGLNINNFNVNLNLNPDLLDRGLGVKRYRTIQLSIGLGYYFK